MAKKYITGIVQRATTMEWSCVKQAGTRFWAQQQRRVDLNQADDESTPAAEGLAEQIKSHASDLKGQITVALPADKCLLRVFELPSADPEELASMVELQMDKVSPFPLENMSMSFEKLSGDEDNTRVLVAGAQRELVESVSEAYRMAGLRVRHMDVDTLGWINLLKSQDAISEEGRQIIFVLDGEGADLVVFDDGAPVLIRPFEDPSDGESSEEYAQELASELSYSMLSIEAERGARPVSDLTIWAQDNPKGQLATRIQETTGLQVETKWLDSLSPLSEGVVRRTVMDQPMKLDLAPTEWETALQEKRARRKLIRSTLTIAGVWLLLAGLGLGVLALQKKRVEKIRAQAERYEANAKKVRALQTKLDSLQAFADRSRSGLESLREFCVNMPEGVEIGNFRYTKGKSVSLKGQADRSELAYSFFKGLEDSSLFEKIDPDVTTKNGKTQYNVSATLPSILGEEDE